MAEGKQKDEWHRTSHLRSDVQNSFGTGKLVSPMALNPFTAEKHRQQRGIVATPENLAAGLGVIDG